MRFKFPTVRWPTAALAAACVLAGLTAAPMARATIQDDSCIEPDIEYPVPCDDDED